MLIFLALGDSCINEVSLEHHEMGHQQWCERNGIFRALQLVDGCDVGQGQLVEFRVLISISFALKRNLRKQSLFCKHISEFFWFITCLKHILPVLHLINVNITLCHVLLFKWQLLQTPYGKTFAVFQQFSISRQIRVKTMFLFRASGFFSLF